MALSCKLFGLQKEDYRSDLLQYEQALQNYMALLDFVFEEMEVSTCSRQISDLRGGLAEIENGVWGGTRLCKLVLARARARSEMESV